MRNLQHTRLLGGDAEVVGEHPRQLEGGQRARLDEDLPHPTARTALQLQRLGVPVGRVKGRVRGERGVAGSTACCCAAIRPLSRGSHQSHSSPPIW